MSFGGHVLDMIKRNNQNQALREKHRKNFKKLYSRSLKNNEGYRTLVKKVVIPEKELQEIKEKIRQRAKQDQVRLILKTSIASLSSIAAIVFIIHLLISKVISSFYS